MRRREEIDVDVTELVQEVHDRLDLLITLLDEKGVLAEKEYLMRMQQYLEEKY